MSAKAALDTEELDSIVVGIVNCDVETQNCQGARARISGGAGGQTPACRTFIL